MYENSIKKQTEGYWEDAEIEYEFKGYKEGTKEEVWEPVRKRRRYYAPVPTITMFNAVNSSNGKYQSINKVEQTTILESGATKKPVSISFTKPKKKDDNSFLYHFSLFNQ